MSRYDDPYHLEDKLITGTSSTIGRVIRLIRKELSEILRDRRTIMTLILMPVLLYPLLSMAFQQFLLANALEVTEVEGYRLGFQSPEDEHEMVNQLGALGGLPPEKREHLAANKIYSTTLPDIERLKAKLTNRRIDLIVLRHSDQEVIRGKKIIEWKLIYLKNNVRSHEAYEYISRQLGLVNASTLVNLPGRPSRAPVIWVDGEGIDPPQRPSELPIGSLIPLILILMTITGAVYPAIDLTAGERERGTLEILVAAPVPRMGLLFAKYVTVVTIAVLTALVNLTMMTVTLSISGLGALLFGDAGLSPMVVLQILGLLLLFAAFFSAVLLTITSFARSFKEAQAYLIPLMLVSLAPGLAGVIPGLQLSPLLSMVPLLNIVLLGRDLFTHQANAMLASIVIFSTVIYSVIAIAMAAKIFGAEDVLYNNQSSWSEAFRRPRHLRRAPSVTNALLCLCTIFLITFFVQGLFTLFGREFASMSMHIRVQTVVVTVLSVVLFAGVPLLAAQMRRVQVTAGFLLFGASPLGFLGAILLGVSLWPLVLELLALMKMANLTTLSRDRQQQIASAMAQLRFAVPLWLLMVSKIIPAFVEEFFFRGFLFSAVRKVAGPLVTIITTALLFGFFHVIVTQAFGLERLIPSTLMGLVLGWVCWKTGSVLPGAILHACHNGILVWVGHLQSQEQSGIGLEPAHIPPLWLAAGAAGALLGALLVYVGGFKKTVQHLDQEAVVLESE